MVIVVPTKGLEEQLVCASKLLFMNNSEIFMQETHFRCLDITALAINKDTLAIARRNGCNLWKECIEEVSAILLSPEQLSSQAFDRLLQHRSFTSRLCALGIDKVHLVQDWGNPSFQEAFRNIALECHMACH